jgi:hypothetical protein
MKSGSPRNAAKTRRNASAQALRAKLIQAGTKILRKLQARNGPTFSLLETAAVLGLSREQVSAMDKKGEVIGLTHRGARVYPAWQFDCGKVRSWVAPVVAATGGAGAAFHFLTVPRRSVGREDGYQSLLAYLLANDATALATLHKRLAILTRE